MDKLTEGDATAVDDSLAGLPALLEKGRLALKQKRGYKAGKLSASRNWCHIVVGTFIQEYAPTTPADNSRPGSCLLASILISLLHGHGISHNSAKARDLRG